MVGTGAGVEPGTEWRGTRRIQASRADSQGRSVPRSGTTGWQGGMQWFQDGSDVCVQRNKALPPLLATWGIES